LLTWEGSAQSFLFAASITTPEAVQLLNSLTSSTIATSKLSKKKYV